MSTSLCCCEICEFFLLCVDSRGKYQSKLTIIGSDSGLSPGRRQPIIWTNAGILSIGALEKNLSEILIKIDIFSFKKNDGIVI